MINIVYYNMFQPVENKLPFTYISEYLGLLFLILIPLNIRITSQFYIHDILAPLMLLCLLLYLLGNWREFFNPVLFYLYAFLIVILILTIFHYKNTTDIYELGIFSYMILIFLFFLFFPLSIKKIKYYGITVIVVIFIFFVITEICNVNIKHQVYDNSSLQILTNRFFFTFEHPNLLGSFYVLPIICIVFGFLNKIQALKLKYFILFILILSFFSFPLVFTASKHILLSIAIVLGLISIRKEFNPSKSIQLLIWMTLIVIFIIFYLTVIFPFFPIKQSFPYINIDTLGMYTIHQEIYLKMILHNWNTFLFGVGRSNVFQAYPQLVNHEEIYSILSQYNLTQLTSTFTRYMDAHNEFLNICASFGVIAVGVLYLFIFKTKQMIKTKLLQKQILVFFISALFMVSFWDDILSKRWIWICLGIILSQLRLLENNRTQRITD